MREETEREAAIIHKKNCQEKLQVLLTQRLDLSNSIDDLLEDIASGTKIMKVYRQMKMYNDEDLNPILYNYIFLSWVFFKRKCFRRGIRIL